MRDETITTPSDYGLKERYQYDYNGDGVIDLTTSVSTIIDANTGARTVHTVSQNADKSIRDDTYVTTSADGLTKTILSDFNGDRVTDLETSSVVQGATTSAAAPGATGTTTTTVETSGNGSFLSETVSSVSDDGLTKVTETDADGSPDHRHEPGSDHRRGDAREGLLRRENGLYARLWELQSDQARS